MGVLQGEEGRGEGFEDCWALRKLGGCGGCREAEDCGGGGGEVD